MTAHNGLSQGEGFPGAMHVLHSSHVTRTGCRQRKHNAHDAGRGSYYDIDDREDDDGSVAPQVAICNERSQQRKDVAGAGPVGNLHTA